MEYTILLSIAITLIAVVFLVIINNNLSKLTKLNCEFNKLMGEEIVKVKNMIFDNRRNVVEDKKDFNMMLKNIYCNGQNNEKHLLSISNGLKKGDFSFMIKDEDINKISNLIIPPAKPAVKKSRKQNKAGSDNDIDKK